MAFDTFYGHFVPSTSSSESDASTFSSTATSVWQIKSTEKGDFSNDFFHFP